MLELETKLEKTKLLSYVAPIVTSAITSPVRELEKIMLEETKLEKTKLATPPHLYVLFPQQPASSKPLLGQAPVSLEKTKLPVLGETKPGKVNLKEIRLEKVKMEKTKLATPPHLLSYVTPSVTSAVTSPVLELKKPS